MEEENLAVVVVPIYKEVLSQNEEESLKQCIKVLSNYNIFLVCHENLNLDVYKRIFNEKQCKTAFFHKQYFKNIDGYNHLLTSYKFYNHFRNYKFLLVYQLDCWVFRDELAFWCQQGYDYIGAPWYEGWNSINANSKFIGVGNGGFSLRKISSCLKVVFSFSYIQSPLVFWDHFKKDKSLKNFKELLLNITISNNSFFLFNDSYFYEDYFWSVIVTKNFTWFKVPELNAAAQFSTEVNAPALFELNNNKLPFGCHAWEKYHPDFWKKYIPAL